MRPSRLMYLALPLVGLMAAASATDNLRNGDFDGVVGGMPATKADTYGKAAYFYLYCQT